MEEKKLRRFGATFLFVALLIGSFVTPAQAAARPQRNFSISNITTPNPSVTSYAQKDFSIVYNTYLSKETVSGGSIDVNSEDVLAVWSTKPNVKIGIGNSEMSFAHPVRLYLTPAGNLDGTSNTYCHTLESSIKVTKDLMIRSQNDSGIPATLTFQQPITVCNGATLLLDNVDNTGERWYAKPDIFINAVADGSAVVVQKGGKLRLGVVDLQAAENVTAPFVDAQGGDVVIQAKATPTDPRTTEKAFEDEDANTSNNDLIMDITTDETLIKASDGASVTIKGGKIASTSATSPAIVFEEGSGTTPAANTLTLIGGEITSSAGSAITVPQGTTLVIPESSTAKVTTTATDAIQAIDLNDGAIIQKGDQSITVGTNETDDNGNDNYVDNNGNIILAKGAKAGMDADTMNAAVILPDGTIVEGSENSAPVVKTETNADTGKTTITVEVPEGGKVTDKDGKVTPMPTGGTATSNDTDTQIEANSVPVTDVTLNKTELSLKVGGSETLTATVSPDNATNKAVTWASSDTTVATVENGTVTAVKAGTTTITVTTVDSTKTTTCTVTVTSASSGGPSTPSYSVTAPAVDNGKVTVSPKYAKKNSTVTLTVTPDEGYELSSLAVTDAKGNVLELTDKGNGKYTFKMPASKVDVTATFKEIPTTHVCPAEKYTDVDTTQWYHEGVDYVIANGMMNGTGTNIFEPNATTTRGMIVTILYRLEKEPAAGTSPFTDVDADQWYAKAVAWAAANGVVNGTSPTTFHPNDPITREQMAAILYRYASFKGYDVTAKADLAGFTDASQISAYAKDAMSWANQEGLIGGVSATTLQPQGSATRAQVATILMRFCENVAK